jgi:hypothetical protein
LQAGLPCGPVFATRSDRGKRNFWVAEAFSIDGATDIPGAG